MRIEDKLQTPGFEAIDSRDGACFAAPHSEGNPTATGRGKMLKLSGCLLFAVSLFAGSSLQVSSNKLVSNDSFPARNTGLSWRVEFYLHDWADNPTNNSLVMSSAALGLNAQLIGGGGVLLQLYNTREAGGSGVCIFRISDLADKAVLVRFQHDPSHKSDYCEMWDRLGNRVFSQTSTYTSENGGSAGVQVGGAFGESRSMAFLRIQSTLVPVNSRTPVTADNSDLLLHWKFDGTLNDTTGRYKGSTSGGSATYVPTPFQGLFVVVKTANAPIWSNWASLRAGYPGKLDGTASFSQTDASSTVSCFWQELSGPSAVRWDDQRSCTPTVSGLIFGDYQFQLTVIDINGTKATASEHIGAVAMDDKGVVISADSKVEQLFGPMIAFGRNPWGYADERALTMVNGQQTYFDGGAWTANQSWRTTGTGTVSYKFAGLGPGPGVPGTALGTGGITSASSTSIPVVDASKLDLSALPAWIMVGASWGASQEIIRICSTTGISGAQTLTACYDGRGLSGLSGQYHTAQAWPAGTIVGQYKISGSGTSFASDTSSALCPAGAPGPPGAIKYSAGTVAMTGGSTALTGSGTTWNPANGVIGSYVVRIAATHAGGTPFVFWSEIASVTDPSHLVMTRSAPADVDATAFSYKIVATRYAVLGFAAPDGALQVGWQYLHGCESETAAYGAAAHDVPGLDATVQSGKTYSYVDGFGAQSAFGSNFYGSGLALRAFYYRSGLQRALDLADRMDNLWVKHPEIAGGWFGGIPLLQGGGVIGAFFNVILNPAAKISWSDVRQFARSGSGVGPATCDGIDARDGGYYAAWVTLDALHDPDFTSRTVARTSLQTINTRDNACKTRNIAGVAAEANSWANGFVFNPAGPPLTLTNGSTTATGTGLTTDMCHGVASGTVNVTNGSAAITGTGLVNGTKIVLTGTKSGATFVGFYQFTQSGGTSGLLSAIWAGDTGPVAYTIESGQFADWLTTIGIDSTAPNLPLLTKNWACTYVSPTQLTLNRSWSGATGSNYHIYTYAIAGYGQQPYMLGIKTTGMTWASALDATLGTNFGANAVAAATWVHDFGYDPVTQGMYYARIMQACEPPGAPPSGSAFGFVNTQCSFGLDPGSGRAARALTAEASSALLAYYLASPDAARKNWGDTAYGSVWGYGPYTTGGVYSDSNYVRDENGNASLASYKWPGFFFGMGMAHQWPAVRLGGADPSSARLLTINLDLSSVPNSVRWRLDITMPTGEKIAQTCSASPCVASVDARQGAPLIQWHYLDASGKVIGESEPTVVSVQ